MDRDLEAAQNEEVLVPDNALIRREVRAAEEPIFYRRRAPRGGRVETERARQLIVPFAAAAALISGNLMQW